MKSLQSKRWIVLTFVLALFSGLSAQAQSPKTPPPDQIETLIASRSADLQRFSSDQAATREANDRFARLTVLTDMAVAQEAGREKIKAEDGEVMTMLLPLLSRQGLIDVSRRQDFRKDPNVQLWLKAQGNSVDKLFAGGRTLLLWAKLMTKDVTVTKGDVEAFVAGKPEAHIVPVRVHLNLTLFMPPQDNEAEQQDQGKQKGTSILAKVDTLEPKLSTKARSEAATATVAPKEWEGLRLYVDVNATDPALRQALTSHKVGDTFGPITLTNGAIVAGKIDEILPEIDLVKSEGYWPYATLLTKLSKVNQVEQYEKLAGGFLQKTPAMRGIFGDVVNWVNNNVVQPAVNWVKDNPFKTVGTAAGVVGTAFTGDPQWIARGWQVGGTLDGLFYGRPGGGDFPQIPQINYQPTMPSGFNGAPYFGAGPSSLPSYTNWNFPQISPLRFVPPPVPQYQQMWMGGYGGYPATPQGPVFAPPIYLPMGPRWF